MPGDGNQRRERMRLARRRPSPDRVRARVRDGGEEPDGGGTRRIDWAKWGTVAGVIAGIGTLLFTAIATYYGAAVSKDQLDQSREDAAREVRSQASRVAAWQAKDAKGDFNVHLRNRSQDPVEGVSVSFGVFIRTNEAPNRDVSVINFNVSMPTLGPCTDAVIEEKSLRYRKSSKASKLLKVPAVELSVAINNVEFWDRDGVRWVRTRSTGLDRVDPGFRRETPDDRHVRIPEFNGFAGSDLILRDVPGCGSESG